LERRLVLATGLAAGLPVIVTTIDVTVSGWTPLADNALIAISSYDVLTSDSPLLGPWSSGYSEIVGRPTFHLGPLLFWLLAVPARLPWPEAMEIVVGLVNLACAIGIVGLAHRRGGRPLMFATAVCLPIMLASLPAEAYSDIWNPYAPLMPLLLLIFLAWSVGCGDHRLLPLAVLVASFAAQSHLSFLAPAAAALAVGVGALVLSRRGALLRPPARTWIVVALAVGAVCWAPTVADQVTNNPGNLDRLYRAARADRPKLGLETGWRALVRTVGVVPSWLEVPPYGLERVVDLTEGPGALATGSTVIGLAGLAGVAVVARRRRRDDVAVAAALALAIGLAMVVVIASTPQDSFETLSYSVRWVSPAGMWVWLALAWGVATLVAGSRRLVPGRLASAGALAAVAAVGAIVAVNSDLRPEPFDETSALAERIESALDGDRPVQLDISTTPEAGFLGLGIHSGIAYSLRREGRKVVVPNLTDYLGPEYGQRPGAQVVRIDAGTSPPGEGRLLARLPVTEFPFDGGLAPESPATWQVSATLVRDGTP
jgi:hypothetical protein